MVLKINLCVGPNSLWALFVTVIVQLMNFLGLCCVLALLACIKKKKINSFPHHELHAKIATASEAMNILDTVSAHCIVILFTGHELIILTAGARR
jgi:hypothetical protein